MVIVLYQHNVNINIILIKEYLNVYNVHKTVHPVIEIYAINVIN